MSVFNDKNIVISGYPKSGTMWTTRLVAQVLDCPVKGYWGVDQATTVMEGNSRNSPWACYISHHLYDELEEINFSAIHKIIYIVRDPRDIVISGAFHFNFYHIPVSRLKNGVQDPGLFLRILKYISRLTYSRKNKIQRMINMLKNGDPYINLCPPSWNNHIDSYLNRDVLFIRYEDLLNDSMNTVKRILSFTGTTRSDTEIMNAINQQSFDVRKDEFLKKGDMVRSKHLRKGKAGDWKNYLSESDSQYLIENFKVLMKKFDYSI